MKKFLCILFLSFLIVGSAFAADSDFTGVWHMNYFSMDGENVMNVSDMGMRSDMILNEDGTVEMTMNMGEEQDAASGTWKATEAGVEVTMSEQTQTAVLQDGFLVFDTGDGGMMIYGREEPAPAFEVADPDKDVKAEDYEGTWVAFKVGMEGVGYFDWKMVAPDMGLDTNEIEIKDGVATLFGDTEKPVELTFEEDGVMADRFENRDYAMLDTVASLREDGTMTLETMTMIFVLEKAEEVK